MKQLWKCLNIALIPPLLPSSLAFKPKSYSFQSKPSSTTKPKMLIVDTDAGFDDFVAMSALINDSQLVPEKTQSSCSTNIGIISTVTGMQEYPSRSKRFFETNFPSLMISVGRDLPHDIDKPDWLIDYRELLNAFLDDNVDSNQLLFDGEAKSKTSNLNKNIESFLATQPNESVDLMCIGPLTNVANWVTSPTTSSLLESKIRSVWIMGGNIPKSTIIYPEFNFLQDPISANIVLSSSVFANKIYIVPEQTCIDIPSDDETYIKIRQISQTRHQGMISRVLQVNDETGPLRYDPLCVFAYLYPDRIELQPIDVNVDPETGIIYRTDDKDVGPSSQTIKFVTFVERFGKKGYLQWLLDLVENET